LNSNSSEAAGIEWLAQMAAKDKWNLTDDNVATLLGGIRTQAFVELRNKQRTGQPVELSADMLERVSLLLGIWKGLQIIAPLDREDLAYAWFSKPNLNPLFNGQSIKEFLLQAKSTEPFYAVRNYLRASCEP
jgi:hypothetical protein